MTLLIIGLVLFLGIHSISIVAPAQRERLRARLGEQRWKGLYSVISLVGFVLLIKGYADARALPELLYSPPQWTRHLMALLMLPVFPLLFAGNLPGRIKSAVAHPMLTATILWSAAHLLGNTTLADALLFGGFLVWAVADLISALRRPRRPLRPAMVSRWNDLIAVGGGLVVYVVFVLWLHRLLIGIAPFAR
jgi:uncharacterized membrane protein